MSPLKSFMISGLCEYDGTNVEYNDMHRIDLVFTNVETDGRIIKADVTVVDHYIGGEDPIVQTTTYPESILTGGN